MNPREAKLYEDYKGYCRNENLDKAKYLSRRLSTLQYALGKSEYQVDEKLKDYLKTSLEGMLSLIDEL